MASLGQQLDQKLKEPMSFEEFWKWIKAAMAIFALGVVWAQLNQKLDAQTEVMKAATARGERMERYLSTRDPNYWQTVKQLE